MITKWLRKKLKFCVALHFSSLRSRRATPHSSKFVRLANSYMIGEDFFFAIRVRFTKET